MTITETPLPEPAWAAPLRAELASLAPERLPDLDANLARALEAGCGATLRTVRAAWEEWAWIARRPALLARLRAAERAVGECPRGSAGAWDAAAEIRAVLDAAWCAVSTGNPARSS